MALGDSVLGFFSRGGQIGTVELDITLREDHSRQAEITTHPVETGIDVSDHIRLLPKRVTMEGLISRTPTQPLLLIKNAVRKRYKESYIQLEKLWLEKEPFTVITSLRPYENMVIESLDVSRDQSTGEVVQFVASMVEIRIASELTLPFLDAALLFALSDPADLGDQTGTPLPGV